MKTIEEIAVECAARSEHSYTNVENFHPHAWVLEAMQEYAKQMCEAQKENCALMVPGYMVYKEYREDLHDIILNTPNVALTKANK